MIEIPFSKKHSHLVLLIDDDDAAVVTPFKWTPIRARNSGTWYARRTERLPNGKQRTIRLHRVLLNAPLHLQVDHRNGNGLDNRRGNLRLATNSQNHQNAGKPRDNISGYKGVFFDRSGRRTKRYAAIVVLNKRAHHAGYFDNPIAAAHAYDAKAKELFGEFAQLNFSD